MPLDYDKPKFPFEWKLADATFPKDKGKVFSCFACGGGSTMGYKLAGFDVIGCNEIDPRMMEVYKANHDPKYAFLESIVDMAKRDDLPAELYDLDILDGSPPCSSFTTNGSRDKGWGKEKKFKEGQAKQVLDTLFFDFIDLAKKLQPKVVVAENVKGMLLGKAMDYTRRVHKEFEAAGYRSTHYLLNGSHMGLPQRRERVFFIAVRNDIDKMGTRPGELFPTPGGTLDMEFNCQPVPFDQVCEPDEIPNEVAPAPSIQALIDGGFVREGDVSMEKPWCRKNGKMGSYFSNRIVYKHKVLQTITTTKDWIFGTNRLTSDDEVITCSSFPKDFQWCDQEVVYLCGMSVPPVMAANVAARVYEAFLK